MLSKHREMNSSQKRRQTEACVYKKSYYVPTFLKRARFCWKLLSKQYIKHAGILLSSHLALTTNETVHGRRISRGEFVFYWHTLSKVFYHICSAWFASEDVEKYFEQIAINRGMTSDKLHQRYLTFARVEETDIENSNYESFVQSR